MLRILILLAAAAAFCRWVTGKWPWDFLSPPSTRSRELFRARKLLAVRPEATREEILDAHRQLIGMVHPDRGGTDGQVHEANAARDLLLDELPDGH